ncbi:hypothetical protein SPHINGO8AM_20016 [Sphingomonas sp. 8AM]|nr:hypothetical protein SPHINGO8AM_20016 [Sphingomonas sp. 8AM]
MILPPRRRPGLEPGPRFLSDAAIEATPLRTSAFRTPAKAGAQLGGTGKYLKHLSNWTPASAGVRLQEREIPHVRKGLAKAGPRNKSGVTEAGRA